MNDCYVDAQNAFREETTLFMVFLQVCVESISCDCIFTRGTFLVVARIILCAWVCGAVLTGKGDIRILYSIPEHLKTAGGGCKSSNRRPPRGGQSAPTL